MNTLTPRYRVLPQAKVHTCWNHPTWDGTLCDPCKGCDEAREHPCRYCGYGHVFPTHSPDSHYEGDDPIIPSESDISDEWLNSPHVYLPATDDEIREVARRLIAEKKKGVDCTADESAWILSYFDKFPPELTPEGEAMSEVYPLEADQWYDEMLRGLRYSRGTDGWVRKSLDEILDRTSRED